MRIRCLYAVLAVAWALAGCTSPSRRIERHPEVFNALSPAQQDLVRRGEIALGFTPDMVRLAWGEPSRIARRTSAAGDQVVWSYRALDPSPGAYPYAGYGGWWPGRCGYGVPYYGYPAQDTYEWGQVVFTDGVVSEIQHLDKP